MSSSLKSGLASQPPRLLRLAEVRRKTGLSTSTIYLLMTRGKFPRQVHIGEKVSAWIEGEIDQFIADRIAERDAKALTLSQARGNLTTQTEAHGDAEALRQLEQWQLLRGQTPF